MAAEELATWATGEPETWANSCNAANRAAERVICIMVETEERKAKSKCQMNAVERRSDELNVELRKSVEGESERRTGRDAEDKGQKPMIWNENKITRKKFLTPIMHRVRNAAVFVLECDHGKHQASTPSLTLDKHTLRCDAGLISSPYN